MKTTWLAAVLLGVLAAGCARCGKTASRTPVERTMPRGAVGVLVVPSLGGAGQKLHLLEQLKVASFAAQLRGFASGKALGDALISQFGFDFREPTELERAGVDGERPAGVTVLLSGTVVVALPVRDEGRFRLAMSEVAKRRLGASVQKETPFDSVTVTAYASSQTAEPELGFVLAHGFALVTDGPGLKRLPALATLSESDALAADPAYLASAKELPSPSDFIVYLPLGTPALARGGLSSAIAAVGLSSKALTATVSAGLKTAPADQGALQPQPNAARLEGYLPNDAFVVARYTGAPSQLEPWLRSTLGAPLMRALSAGDFSLRTEVLERLEPGVSVALSLSDEPPMALGLPALDFRQTNPFAYANLSGVAKTNAPDAVFPTLQKVAALAPRFGAEMELKTRADGQRAMVTTYGAGEGVHFSAKDDRVYFASPIRRLEQLVASDGSGGPRAMEADSSAALNVRVDFRALAAGVRALPDTAWGLGGFAIKATTERWLEATDDVSSITVSAGAKEQRLRATVVMGLALEGGKRP